jgi:hypothetical protein
MQGLLSFFCVYGVCRRNYSHTVFKYGNKHTTVQGRFGSVERPTAPSREGEVLIPAAAGTFLCSFFLKTVRCHLNSILFMNLHYSAVRNKKWFQVLLSHQPQKYLCRFDDACNAAKRVIGKCRTNYSQPVLKYGNKHLPVMGELALWHDLGAELEGRVSIPEFGA